MKNKISVSDNLISKRIHDPYYSLASFNQLLINKMLNNYNFECLYAILAVAPNFYLFCLYYCMYPLH